MQNSPTFLSAIMQLNTHLIFFAFPFILLLKTVLHRLCTICPLLQNLLFCTCQIIFTFSYTFLNPHALYLHLFNDNELNLMQSKNDNKWLLHKNFYLNQHKVKANTAMHYSKHNLARNVLNNNVIMQKP